MALTPFALMLLVVKDSWAKILIGCAVIGIVTAVLYIPAMQSGFVWDDDKFLHDNPLILDRADGLYRFWCSTDAPDYFPLTSSMLWIEWGLWGKEAKGYHIMNVILHALSAMLLWRILRKLAVPGAWFAAFIFAIHPVCVETVAWITERKNTLPMALALASLLMYIKSEPKLGTKSEDPTGSIGALYFVSIGLFFLALLAKTAVIGLPIVLTIIVLWKKNRLVWDDAIRLAPFYVLSALLSSVTVWFQYNRSIADMVVRTDGPLSRLLGAATAVWFYLFKALIPINLQFVYPRWNIDTHSLAWYLPLIGLAALAILLWKKRESGTKPLLITFSIYIVMLLPILGFFSIFFMLYSLVADHWQYVAIPAVIACAVGYGTRFLSSFGSREPLPSRQPKKTQMEGERPREPQVSWPGVTVALIITIAFLFQSWNEQSIYKNEETFYRGLIEQRWSNWMAQNNLGAWLYEHGRIDEAMAQWDIVLEVKPDHPEAHNNKGRVYGEQDNPYEALKWCTRAVELRPGWGPVHRNVARLLGKTGGDPRMQVYHYHEVLKKNPNDRDAAYELAVVYGQNGSFPDAVKYFNKAIGLKPDWAEAHHGLAAALTQLGRQQEAYPHLQQAIALNPMLPEAQTDMGTLWFNQGNLEKAAYHYEQALRGNPSFFIAGFNLASTYAELGKFQRAVQVAEQSLAFARKANDEPFINDLEKALITYREGRTLSQGPSSEE